MKLTGKDIAKAKRLINDALDEIDRLELKDDTLSGVTSQHLMDARAAIIAHVKK